MLSGAKCQHWKDRMRINHVTMIALAFALPIVLPGRQVVRCYGGSLEYALIRSQRLSEKTSRKQGPLAPIFVTPKPHRKADRQMLADAFQPSVVTSIAYTRTRQKYLAKLKRVFAIDRHLGTWSS
jgi:hypothetical protein